MKTINRRNFLTALGLGGASYFLPSLAGPGLRAQTVAPPRRVVFYVTPHGMTPKAWRMGSPASGDTEFDLVGRPEADWSTILRPLYRHRRKTLVLDNVSAATAMAEINRVGTSGSGDANAHHVGQAHLMTCDWALQRPGDTALGGARSIDVAIGAAVGVPGRWAQRVYGAAQGFPYSFLASNEPTPREYEPQVAFSDIMSIARPTTGEPMTPTRAQRIDQARASVLDLAAGEYERVMPRLGSEDRMKLDRHRQLVRDLELGLSGTIVTPGGATCDPQSPTGARPQQFARIVSMALACDLTRVVTFVTDPLEAAEFGAPAGIDVHQDIAHASVEGDFGYTANGERMMIDMNRVEGERFAQFLDRLDSIPEGSGTLLDNTAVVWLTELGTGTHSLTWQGRVIVGATSYFRSGRYIRYANRVPGPDPWGSPNTDIGPGMNQLYVSVMHSVGLTETSSFGLSSILDDRGVPYSLTGPLPLLR